MIGQIVPVRTTLPRSKRLNAVFALQFATQSFQSLGRPKLMSETPHRWDAFKLPSVVLADQRGGTRRQDPDRFCGCESSSYFKTRIRGLLTR